MTIIRDDIPMWQTLRSFLKAGGSPSFPKVIAFAKKYGMTDLNAFYRLEGIQAPEKGVKTSLGENMAPSEALDSGEKMIRNLEKLGMIPKIPDPLDQCPF